MTACVLENELSLSRAAGAAVCAFCFSSITYSSAVSAAERRRCQCKPAVSHLGEKAKEKHLSVRIEAVVDFIQDSKGSLCKGLREDTGKEPEGETGLRLGSRHSIHEIGWTRQGRGKEMSL